MKSKLDTMALKKERAALVQSRGGMGSIKALTGQAAKMCRTSGMGGGADTKIKFKE